VIKVEFNSSKFMSEMTNVVNYSIGFLDGVQSGRNQFLTKLGAGLKEILKEIRYPFDIAGEIIA
jgi:hypothetical protein